MKKLNPTWSIDDLSSAMENAIYGMATPKLIRKVNNKISFNGFWRDGDKQNVCVWLNKATWHDAKTGEGGGCKEFAKTAFNMGLSEFMDRYGPVRVLSAPLKLVAPVSSTRIHFPMKTVHEVWTQLQKVETSKADLAGQWLSQKRGIQAPRQILKCGFANLCSSDAPFFDINLQGFIAHRAMLGPQIVVPLRATQSDQVKNLFFRSIVNGPKEEKSRLLPNVGGWTELDGSPRAFGFPHRIKACSHVILCEGMADYFAAQFLIKGSSDFLPIGASNADGIVKWAKWLISYRYKGRITVLFQLDGENSPLSTKKIGPAKAIEAFRYLRENHMQAELFDWPFYLSHTSTHPTQINDIADSLSTEAKFGECGSNHLHEVFVLSLGSGE